ncbi:MAG: hypothetical protein A2W47_05785 [Gammaproteobacteria bacterium RIFCSPHIGHO2_12_38_15]|nr:MAG: hypothetical protein A2W47_05785 [Gammaproteobacteria bacterium RIFCSPHIGHO2_12_38_15]
MPNEDEKQSIPYALSKGVFSGVADATFNYPWLSLRKLFQSDHPIELKPSVLFRGVSQYAFTIIPTTGIQFSVYRGLTNHSLFKKNDEKVKFYSSLVSGMASAFFSTASERLVLEQGHHKNKSLFQVLNIVQRQEGYLFPLWRGLSAFTVRDGIYTLSMFYFYDHMKRAMKENFQNSPGYLCSVFSALCSGFIATTLTQPVDHAGVLLQRSSHKETLCSVIVEQFKKGGIAGVYKGYFFRLGGVSAGIFVMRCAEEIADKTLLPQITRK